MVSSTTAAEAEVSFEVVLGNTTFDAVDEGDGVVVFEGEVEGFGTCSSPSPQPSSLSQLLLFVVSPSPDSESPDSDEGVVACSICLT